MIWLATGFTLMGMFIGSVGASRLGFAAESALAAGEERFSWAEDQTSRGMREVLEALKSKERAIERRERNIVSREADLRKVEDQLEKRLLEMEKLREDLQVLLEATDEQREEKVTSLVKMIESMRSAQGAGVMAVLDDDLAIEVLERMNKGKAGKMLAKMDPARAASLAEQLTRKPLTQP